MTLHLATPNDAERPAKRSSLFRVAAAVRASGYDFVTITPSSHALVNARPCNSEARTLTDVLGWSRPFSRNIMPELLFGLMSEAGLLEQQGALWQSKVRFSTLNGDLYIHSAFPTKARDAVFFGPDTYKFVDAINAWLANGKPLIHRAADVCAGGGPGAITIAKAFPGAEVLMLDINPKSLEFAAVNAGVAGCDNAYAVESDLFSNSPGRFDLVVAHPPYLIDEGARAYRHGGGPLGAGTAMKVLQASIGRLAPNGTLLLFTGVAIVEGSDPFQSAASRALYSAGLDWTYREVDPDVFGEELAREPYQRVDRIALVILTATKKVSS
jgi:release factor glutamine methyltransferase